MSDENNPGPGPMRGRGRGNNPGPGPMRGRGRGNNPGPGPMRGRGRGNNPGPMRGRGRGMMVGPPRGRGMPRGRGRPGEGFGPPRGRGFRGAMHPRGFGRGRGFRGGNMGRGRGFPPFPPRGGYHDGFRGNRGGFRGRRPFRGRRGGSFRGFRGYHDGPPPRGGFRGGMRGRGQGFGPPPGPGRGGRGGFGGPGGPPPSFQGPNPGGVAPQKPIKCGKWLVWKSKNGRPYYQNVQNPAEVKWEKPPEVEALQKQHPEGPPQGPPPQGPPPQGPGGRPPNTWIPSQQPPNQAPQENWVEYRTAEGVSFYSNIITKKTTFKRPQELEIRKPDVAAEKMEEDHVAKIDPTNLPKTNAAKESFKSIETVVNKTKEKKSWVHDVSGQLSGLNGKKKHVKKTYKNEEERVEAFKCLLREKKLTENDKWESFLRKIIADERYRAIKTLKQRKQVFETYQKDIVDERHNAKKLEKQKAKDAFFEMLKDCKGIVLGIRPRDAADLCRSDPRYKMVRRGEDREWYVREYVKEVDRVAKEKLRAAQKDLNELFTAEGDFHHQSTWRDCENKFSEHDLWRNSTLDTIHKKKVFNDVIDVLRRKKEKEERAKAEEKRRLQKAEEDEFLKCLDELAFEHNPPLFHSKTPFEEFVDIDTVQKEERCAKLKKSRYDTAYDLFEKFCWKLDAKLRNKKKILKALLKSKEYEVMPDSTVAELEKTCKEFAKEKDGSSDPVDDKHIRLIALEMIAKAKYKQQRAREEREEEEERERRDRERKSKKKKRKREEKDDSSGRKKKKKKKHKKSSESPASEEEKQTRPEQEKPANSEKVDKMDVEEEVKPTDKMEVEEQQQSTAEQKPES